MSVFLAELTSPEVGVAIEAGTVVVVPIGSIEQHGPHLPIETDSFLAATVAERSVRRARDNGTPALVTPPIWTGYSPHHMEFPGTLTLDASTFFDVVSQVSKALWHHGFRKIFLLNRHGGNANLLGAAVQRLRFEEEVRVASASYWSFATQAIQDWRTSGPGGIDHACEMETSLMLAVRPDLVRANEARDAAWFPHSEFLTGDLTIGAPVSVAWSFRELTEDGTLGDAAKGNAGRGEELLEAIVEAVGSFVEEFAEWDWERPLEI